MSIVVVHANPALAAMGEIQDRLLSALASQISTWNLELKLYRANPASFGHTGQLRTITYTVQSSDAPGVVCLFTGQEALLTDRGLLPILQSKMQSLWVARQTLRGDGFSFEIDGTTVRLANVFVQGNYKGLIVQIEHEGSDEEVLARAREVLEQYRIPGELPAVPSHTRLEVAREYQRVNK